MIKKTLFSFMSIVLILLLHAQICLAQNENDKFGYINKKSQFVIKPQFDSAGLFSEGLAAVEKNDKYGYIDKTGKIIIPLQFDDALPFSEGLAAVRVNEEWEYIDKIGKVAFNPSVINQANQWYNQGEQFSNGLIPVAVRFPVPARGFDDTWRGDVEGSEHYDETGKLQTELTSGIKWGYVDKTGKFVIQPQFYYAGDFSEGLAQVAFRYTKNPDFDCKFGYIDKTGKFVIQPQFFGDISWATDGNTIYSFSEGLVCFRLFFTKDGKNRFGCFDKTGKLAIKPQFDFIDRFSEGLAKALKNDTAGYITKTGKFIIPQFAIDWGHEYSNKNTFSGYFSEGFAPAEINGKYGYIDKTGKLVIKPRFNDAYPFSEGLAKIAVGDKYGYIDKTGKFVIKPQFPSAYDFSNGLAAVAVHGRFRIIQNEARKRK